VIEVAKTIYEKALAGEKEEENQPTTSNSSSPSLAELHVGIAKCFRRLGDIKSLNGFRKDANEDYEKAIQHFDQTASNLILLHQPTQSANEEEEEEEGSQTTAQMMSNENVELIVSELKRDKMEIMLRMAANFLDLANQEEGKDSEDLVLRFFHNNISSVLLLIFLDSTSLGKIP